MTCAGERKPTLAHHARTWHTMNVRASARAQLMMFACGPFCACCSSLLRVEACQRCARAQAATDTERAFEALGRCAQHGGTHCEHGVAMRVRPVPHPVRPKDVQWLAAVCVQRYPRGIVVFHLGERACCLFARGAAPALVELADAAAHLTAPALALVVLGGGRGLASLDISRA